MRLKIQLFRGWLQHDLPNAAATFYREGSNNPFQVSWAEYTGKQTLPELTKKRLEEMAVNFGRENDFGKLVESDGDECRFGKLGTAVFSSEHHERIQVWFVSDGRDHIMATHICEQEPDAEEVAEAQQIAASLALGPDRSAKPRWKFW